MRRKSIVWMTASCMVGFACLSASADSTHAISTVNGVAIPASALEQLVRNGAQQGVKDSAELRVALKNDLIVKEILSQEAMRQGLDKDPALVMRLSLLRSDVLADAVISKYLQAQPMTEEVLRSEYKRQVEFLADAEESLVSHIVLATEVEALAVTKLARTGQAFDQLAKANSLDSTGKTGGQLGWLLPSQLVAPLANVVANMSKGAVSTTPILTSSGWQVIKLEDKRPFKVPGFDEARPKLQEAVMNIWRSAYVGQLIKLAKIQ